MSNYAYQNRDELSKSNYVRIASPNTNYWVDFSFNKLDGLAKSGNNFSLIIIGDTEKVGDFYAIPFDVVSHLFSPTALYQEPKRRWIASITHHQLRVRNAPSLADVGAFYGAIYLLNANSSAVLGPHVNEQEQNEYAIENRRIEIEARQKQSVFRASVLANFENKCCISGIGETDMLVAGHIVPWADRIESRLDPANGLCLFVLYDKLFDLGYISLDDNLCVITADSEELSPELHSILQKVEGRSIIKPVNFPVNLDYIRYHRSNIFRG